MNAPCPASEDVNAYVAEELAPADQTRFQMHLADCEACRAEVESTRKLVHRLLALPEVECNLAPSILEEMRNAPLEVPRRSLWSRVAAAAALVTAFSGGIHLWQRPPVDPSTAGVSPSGLRAIASLHSAASTSRAIGDGVPFALSIDPDHRVT